LARFPSSPEELTKSLTSLWTEYSGTQPTTARTEVRGDVVTCVLIDAVEDFNLSMNDQCINAAQTADTVRGVGKLTPADYKRDAVAAVARLTHRRVVSFMSSHDRDTDVATEVFTLEGSAANDAPRSRREPETVHSPPPPRA
jgi:hypothetical protein